MNLTSLFRFRRSFLIHVLTRLSPILPRYGTRNQILDRVSSGSVTGLEIPERCLFLSLEIIDFLMLAGKPLHDINLVIFAIWLLRRNGTLQIITAQ